MAITNYGIVDSSISFGGTDCSALLNGGADVEREAILQEFTPFSVAWPAWLATGSKKLSDLTLVGVEDFGTTTSRSIFAEGTSGSLVVTYGGAKTTTVTCIVNKYTTVIASEKLHVFKVVLRPTGTCTEA